MRNTLKKKMAEMTYAELTQGRESTLFTIGYELVRLFSLPSETVRRIWLPSEPIR